MGVSAFSRVVVEVAAALSMISPSLGADGTWTNLAGGAWSTAGNWSGGNVATGTTGVAYFTNAITASRTVTVNSSPWTINGMTFGCTGAFERTVSGGTLILAGTAPTLTVNPGVAAKVFSSLSGSGGLVKAGTGTLTLGGTNTYGGGTAVSSGFLDFAVTNAKPASGVVTVSAAAGLGLGVGGTSCFSSANVNALWAGTFPGVTLAAASRIGIDTSAGDFTYPTGQSTHSLVKLGANTLTLTGINTYSGVTVISAGVLSIATTAALPGWDTSGRYAVASGAALAAGDAVGDADIATMLATSNFAANACVGFDTSEGDRYSWGYPIGNTANGTLGLVKIGANALIFEGANTFDGTATVNGGILVAMNSGSLGSTNGVTVINRVGGTGPDYADATGQLQLAGNFGNLAIGENLLLNGSSQYNFEGPLCNVSGDNVLNGWIQLGALGGRVSVTAGSLTLNGTVGRGSGIAGAQLFLNPYPDTTLTVSNVIDLGAGDLYVSGGGLVTVDVSGNTCNQTLVQDGSVLRLGIDDALPAAKTLVLGGPASTGTFDLYGFNQTLAGLQEQGTAATLPDNVIANSNPSNTCTLTLNQPSGANDTFSGRIAGALNLVKAGAANSRLTLSGTNTFTGVTTVSAGTLSLGNPFALGAGGLTVVGGATVNLNYTGTRQVTSLILGGVPMPGGTYGSSGSPAAFPDAHFTGNGTITVVCPPAISLNALNQTAALGAGAAFAVAASGTAPFTYQWRRNGVAIPDETGATLTLSGLTFADAGNYDAVVSNFLGFAVSAPAQLLVTYLPAVVSANYTYDALGCLVRAAGTAGIDRVSYVYDDAHNLTFAYPAFEGPDLNGNGIPDAWEVRYFGSTSVVGMYTDYNHNGEYDFLDYAFGNSPSSSARPAGFRISVRSDSSSGFMYLTYRRNKYATQLKFKVLVSDDLMRWQPGDAYFQQAGAPADNLDGTETVTLRPLFATDAFNKLFARICVEAQ